MKIGNFNENAPKLINSLNDVLNKLLNKDLDGLNVEKLRNSLTGAANTVEIVQKSLNSVSVSTLTALRANNSASDAYGDAVTNAASLSSLVGVLNSILNEMEPEMQPEESIDDILGKEPENMGDPEPEEGIDDIMENKGAGCDTKPDAMNGGSSESGSSESYDGVQAAVDPKLDDAKNSFDIPEDLLNFSPTNAAVSSQKAKNHDSEGMIPLDFLN